MLGLPSSYRQMVGMVIKPTVTVKLHVAVLPDASVAVQVTGVMPTRKHEPDLGLHSGNTASHWRLALAAKLTTTHSNLDAAVVTMFAGQWIVRGGCGGALSVMVNVQLGPAVVEQMTVVVPGGKNDPEGGLQVTPPHWSGAFGAG